MAQADSPFLKLELVCPTGLVYEGEASMVVLPAVTGEMGIMARHAPLVTQLATGVLRVMTEDGQWLVFAVSEGFAKVQFDKVIVLADFAAAADDIDVAAAQSALQEAEKRLEMHQQGNVPEGEEVDPFREQLAIRQAKNLIKVAEMA